jgi:hypothetical protein
METCCKSQIIALYCIRPKAHLLTGTALTMTDDTGQK